ncbi:MAG: PE-PPE domain-containing protein [Actinomycetia bacterium]|nr:PE-PPE domain-containing protein [Actinomycetes bacterium]
MGVVGKVAAGARRRQRRQAKCLVAAIASVPLVVLPAVGTAAAADAPVFDALPPGPARVLTVDTLTAGGNADDLQGVVCEAPRVCTAVPYPYLNRPAGVVELDEALRTYASEQLIVYGYSQGARVAKDWLDQYAGTEDALSPSALSFVLIGNPGRKYGGSRVGLDEMTPDTEYNVLDVSRQYDLSSDTPDNPLNLLAMINAYAGFSSIHVDYEDVDIYDPANYVWTEGNTTYVFVPTERLPILGFLYGVGLAGLADALDAPLRAQIEKAYDRSYLPAEPGLPALEPEAEPEPEQPAVETEQPQAAAAALRLSPSATTGGEYDTESPVPDGADTREESEDSQTEPVSEAAGMTVEGDFNGADAGVEDAGLGDADLGEADLDEAGVEEAGLEDADLGDADLARPGDVDDDTLESEADEDRGAVAAASVSEGGDAQSSSGEESSSSDSDSPAGGQSPSASES